MANLPLVLSAFVPTNGTPDYPGGPFDRYQSITAMPQYRQVSFEEMRLKHYRVNKPPNKSQVLVPAADTAMDMSRASVNVFASKFYQRKFTCSSAAANHSPYEADIITFVVGTADTKDFIIHRAAVTSSSGFVHDAMKDGWKTAKDRVIPLPDDEPAIFAIFAIYQTWLYKHCIPTDYASADEYEILVKAYILGDKLRDVQFKDAVIDCVMERLRRTNTFDLRLTNLVYEDTLENSPLRRLWCDIYQSVGNASWLEDSTLADPINADLLKQLAGRQYKMNFKQGLLNGSQVQIHACSYHEHDVGTCYLDIIAKTIPQLR